MAFPSYQLATEVGYSFRGAEISPEVQDHHCPQMFYAGPNTTRSQCQLRQRKGGGCYGTDCKAAIGVTLAAVKMTLCPCGKEALSKSKLKRHRLELDERICPDCLKAILAERTRQYKNEQRKLYRQRNPEKSKEADRKYQERRRAKKKAAANIG